MNARDRLFATVDRLCAANPDAPLARLRAATLAARERARDERIGMNVRQGVYAVCLVTYQGKRSNVETLADGLTVEGAISYLNGMN